MPSIDDSSSNNEDFAFTQKSQSRVIHEKEDESDIEDMEIITDNEEE
jgi:hypothetical protein